MINLYFATPIDVRLDKAKEQIETFKKLFAKFSGIQVYVAGFNDSPIIELNTTWTQQRIIVAYDLRILRQCDILLIVTDTRTFCAGTFMELEYARQLGLYTILLSLSREVKNIFLLTLVDRIVYSVEELEEVLEEICRLWK